jgi:PadR family transcriptional regulator, regulatory protein AphA
VTLEFILLGLLGEPRSGYDLKAEFGMGAAHFWAAEFSQIYSTLHRMHRRGWLHSRRTASDAGPPRRLYRRTAAGTRALQRWLSGEPEFGDERYAFVAQVYFLADLPRNGERMQFMRRLHDRLTERHAALRAVEEAWRRASPDYPDRLAKEDFFPQLTLRLGLAVAEARLAWSGESIRRMEARRGERTTA